MSYYISYRAISAGRGDKARQARILKFSAKRGCFLSFEWAKPNFITFGPPLEKFWKNPQVPPWKKSFRRLCIEQMLETECRTHHCTF